MNWSGREVKALVGRAVYSKLVCERIYVSMLRELHKKCMCDFGSSLTICRATAIAGYKCPPVPPPAKKKCFSSDGLEIVTESHIHICIILKLAEERLRVVPEEDIASDFDRQGVVDFVIDVRTHIHVLVRRAVVRE